MSASWKMGLSTELSGTTAEKLAALTALAGLGKTGFDDVVDGGAYRFTASGAEVLEEEEAELLLLVVGRPGGSAPWDALGDGYTVNVGIPNWKGPARIEGTGSDLDGQSVGPLSVLLRAAQSALSAAEEADGEGLDVCAQLCGQAEWADEYGTPFTVR